MTSAREDERIAALQALKTFEPAADEPFRRVTRIGKTLLAVPVCHVSLIGANTQWLRSEQTLAISECPRHLSFCTYTIEIDEPLVVPDALLDARFAQHPFVVGAPFVRYYIGAQLRTRDGHNIGALCGIDTVPRPQTHPEIVAGLQDLAQIVIDELELRRIATSDSLTSALTRRGFIDLAEHAFARAHRDGRPLACIVLDVDHFKRVNDAHGHAAGDEVLRRLVQIAKAELRECDRIGRLGGEEFAVLLPEVGAGDALAVAERFRCRIEGQFFSIGGETFAVTISAGVAEASAGSLDLAHLIAAADGALYRAKHGGRNRVALADGSASGWQPASDPVAAAG
ncbi:sensor domain-containing diguanylate cyclase [Segnochrobactrum spirostomi]|uniref:sensor domain-containing diguanylate cyclase n=1 Tax=Segnochrobactrum spirostomi TaxID=2608987 RepID=UPI001AD82531|nr:sensor domain-containing diguanylate cyclase [Segnochrobactrum spirostomi]